MTTNVLKCMSWNWVNLVRCLSHNFSMFIVDWKMESVCLLHECHDVSYCSEKIHCTCPHAIVDAINFSSFFFSKYTFLNARVYIFDAISNGQTLYCVVSVFFCLYNEDTFVSSLMHKKKRNYVIEITKWRCTPKCSNLMSAF